MVQLTCNPVNATMIAVYSPVNPNGKQQLKDASDVFYTDLQCTFDKAPKNNLVLLTGDFNARVGIQQHRTSGSIVGPHAVDHINKNGQRLIDFYTMNNLCISNTFFAHKPIHQMTWMHPGNKKWHMIDYTIVN